MKITVIETALSNIGKRLAALDTHARQIKSLTITPKTILPVVESANKAQKDVISALEQIKSDLVDTAAPMLHDWLMAYGAVVGEEVCFTITDRIVNILQTPALEAAWHAAGRPHRPRVHADEVQICGRISKLALDRYSRDVSVILTDYQVVHRSGSVSVRQPLEDVESVSYRKENYYRNSIDLRISPLELSIGIPIRLGKHEDLAMTKG